MTQTEIDKLTGLLGGLLAQNVAPPVLSLAVNGACPIDRDAFILMTKAGVLALSIAAPGAANIGRVLQIYGATADQNVLTFTGGTLRSGAAGVTTVTGAAAIGSGITVKAVTATTWQLLNNTLAVVT
jgi:NAD(P)H-hydrate repair Nnr-like enzyme with NAD(P)H-hydrate dehydratase domain